MSRSRHWENHPKVVQWLQQNGYAYEELNNGYQLRILGEGRIVDLWPGSMTYHVVAAENEVPSDQSDWPSIGPGFNPKELAKILTEDPS